MAEVIPADNASAEMRPWVRWMNEKVTAFSNAFERFINDQGNANKAANAALNLLTSQVSGLREALLYQQNLVTRVAQGDTTEITASEMVTIPWVQPASIPGVEPNSQTLLAHTGRVLVTMRGDVEIEAGDRDGFAYITFRAIGETTGTIYREVGNHFIRLKVSAGTTVASSISRSNAVNVPYDEPVRYEVWLGYFSYAAAATPTKITFTLPGILIQVVDPYND